MRVLVCGGRDYGEFRHGDGYPTQAAVERIKRERRTIKAILVQRLNWGDTLVHGAARGADTHAAIEASRIPGIVCEAHPANWAKHGKRAGPIRNQEMLDTGIDLVIAFPGGSGTADMVGRAKKAGVPVVEVADLAD